MRRTWTVRAGALLALLLLVVACTDDDVGSETSPPPSEPAPTPTTPIGSRVAIVLPPTSVLDPAILAAVEIQLEQLASDTGDRALRLRTSPSADPRFVEDLAAWASG